MKKKLFTILLCGVLVLGLSGCGEEKEKEDNNKDEVKEPTKLNLNHNIEVYESLYSTLCGGWYFTTNAEDLFPIGIITYDNYKVIDVGGEIAPHEWAERVNQLTFDENKESAAKVKFDEIDATNQLGIAKYTSSFENHEFYYEYYTIELVDATRYADVTNELQNAHTNFKVNFTSIFYDNGAYLKKGACGGPIFTPVILTEELCETYNLNCGRW